MKKCLDDILALPVGSVLLRINDELIAPDAIDDTLRSLHTWSTSTNSSEALRLRFFIKPESPPDNTPLPSSSPNEDNEDPALRVFVNDITHKTRASLGIDICTPYIKTLCIMNRYLLMYRSTTTKTNHLIICLTTHQLGPHCCRYSTGPSAGGLSASNCPSHMRTVLVVHMCDMSITVNTPCDFNETLPIP